MTHPDYRALCSAAIELWEADCDMESVISDMRTALAQPEPVAPSDEELPEEVATLIPWLLEEAAQAANAGRPTAADMLTLAAQLLGERGPTLTPIPVCEQLPTVGDFDAGGRCWYFGESCDGIATAPTWSLTWRGDDDTHWLPHYALPLPAAPGEERGGEA